MDEKKSIKQNIKKIIGAVMVVSAAILALLAYISFNRGINYESDTDQVPKNATEVTTEGEFVTDTMSYLTDAVSYFQSSEDSLICLSVYDTESDYHITPICIKKSEGEKYLDYIKRTYDINAPEPVPLVFTGYSEVIDANLEQAIRSGMAYQFGHEFSDEEYTSLVLPIYVVLENVKAQYEHTMQFITLCAVASVLLLVGIFLLLQKNPCNNADVSPISEINSNSFLLGIVGAIIGATVGGILWGFASFSDFLPKVLSIWAFILTYYGFVSFCKGKPTLAIVVSYIFSTISTIGFTFLSAGLLEFKQINNGKIGFVGFRQAIVIANKSIKENVDLSSALGKIILGNLLLSLGVMTILTGVKKIKSKSK